jgi:hypothetical protein
MMEERKWRRAIEQSWVVRLPKQGLATFGSTNISYHVVTEPIYQDPEPESHEGVIRTGRVIAERPAIITPNYFLNLQGFSEEAYEYFTDIAHESGRNSPGIMYEYKNETEKMEIVGGIPSEIARNISKDLNRKNDQMAVVLVGIDELWDVALLKFIYEFTASSIAGNVQDLNSRGMLDPMNEFGGVPRAAVQQIDRLFREAEGGGDIELLKQELDRWGVFDHYQDRFLDLFRTS